MIVHVVECVNESKVKPRGVKKFLRWGTVLKSILGAPY